MEAEGLIADRHRGWGWGLLLALVAGALLRTWNLRVQLLLGDELHAVRSALDWQLPRILTTYRLADNSIPLTALYRLLVKSGVVLTESVLRLPSLVAGLGLLVALPWAVRRELGGRVALTAAWLAAVSPVLVYYARNSRPYAVIVLLCLAAVAAFWQWWVRGGRWAWALLYCVAGAGAVWLHLGAAPLVAAPLAFAAWEAGRDLVRGSPEGPARLRRLAAALAGLLGLIALFLVPARASFLHLLKVRPGESSPTPESILGTLALQAGVKGAWLAVVFWAIALAGLWLLFRERPRLAAYSAFLVGVQWAAVALVLRPSGVGKVIILNRYLAVTLPIVLVWAAFGVDRGARSASRAGLRRVAWAVPPVLVLALVAGGPHMAHPGLYFGPFAGSNAAVNFLDEPAQVPAERIPAVYRTLAWEPGPGAVLEAPRSTAWWRNHGPLAYSLVHGRRVVIGSFDHRLLHPGLRLRNLVPLDPARMAGSGARFVVVDLEPRDPTTLAPPDPPRWVREAAEARRLVRRLEEAWGEPSLVEGSLRVWDLSATLRPTA